MNPDDRDRNAQGMFYGSVKLSSKGQIVIPQRVRVDFGLRAGDQLIVVGRPEQGGFALMKPEGFLRVQQELARVQAELSQYRGDGSEASAAQDDTTDRGPAAHH